MVTFWEKLAFWWKVEKCYEIGGKLDNFSRLYHLSLVVQYSLRLHLNYLMAVKSEQTYIAIECNIKSVYSYIIYRKNYFIYEIVKGYF